MKSNREEHAKSYAPGLSVNITSLYPILWWLTAGLVLIDQLGPAVLVGFFSGLLLWISLFPLALREAQRRIARTYQAVLVFSIVCLAAFAAWLVWSAVAVLLCDLPAESQVFRQPDFAGCARHPERRNAGLRHREVVHRPLVRGHGGLPFRRPRVEPVDEDAAFPVGDADHAVRALVQLASDRLPAMEVRQARVRHQSDDLPLPDRLADRPHRPLEQLVRLAHLDVLVEEHRRQARQHDEAGAGLLDLFIQHIQY